MRLLVTDLTQVIAACLRLRSMREPAVQFDKDKVFQTDDMAECFVKAEVLKAGVSHQIQTTLRTPNEHTLPLPQTTGRSSPHTWHPKKHWSTPSNAPHINISWTPTPTIPYRGPSSPLKQQKNTQCARQMHSGLTDPTTHAGTPSCEPLNQHLTHVPQR